MADDKQNGVPGVLEALEALSGEARRTVEAMRAQYVSPKAPVDLVEHHEAVLAPDAPAPMPVEEAALAFNYEFGAPANNNDKPAEVIAFGGGEQSQKREENVAEASELLKDILALEQDVQLRLVGEIQQLRNAIKTGSMNGVDTKAIRDAIDKAQTAVETARADETPQQKVDRLFKEMAEIKDEADKILDTLHLSEEEIKQRKEIEQKLKDAQTSNDPAAWEELAEYYKKIGKKYDRAELVEAGKRIEQKAAESRSIVKETLESKYQHSDSLAVQDLKPENPTTTPNENAERLVPQSVASQVSLADPSATNNSLPNNPTPKKRGVTPD